MAYYEDQKQNRTNNEDEFIQEKILKKRRQNAVKRALTIIFVLVCGVVFGFAARMSMLFTDNKLKDLFGNLGATSTPVVTEGVSMTPTDMVSLSETPAPTSPVISSVPVTFTPAPSDVTVISPLPTLEPVEGEIEVGVIDPDIPHPEFSYSSFYKEVTTLAEAVRPQVADITAVRSYIDWFGDTSYINTLTSGLILANNGTELLILTDYNAVVGSASIGVRLFGKELEGAIFSYDPDFGLALISVNFSEFTEEERGAIKYAKLLEDSEIKMGNPVVAVGNVNGYSGSIAFGIISGAGYKTYVTDGQVKCFTTDWTDYKSSSAFIYDMSGAVCGMITHTFKQNTEDGITTCVSLEGMRNVINALLNKRVPLYMGLSCSDLTAAISAESGLNFGIYIREVKGLSPAALVGLRSGDIIVAVNEQRVQSISELTMYLSAIQEGDTITIDYRRISEAGIKDERVIITPVSKLNHAEQKGK